VVGQASPLAVQALKTVVRISQELKTTARLKAVLAARVAVVLPPGARRLDFGCNAHQSGLQDWAARCKTFVF
jgi:hypothetical protein